MSDLGNKKVLAKNLNYYMKINSITRTKLCKDLDLKYTTVREWVNGTAYPRIDKIEMLANYFDILKSDLIEEKNTNQNEADILINLLKTNKDKLNKDDIDTIKFLVEKRIKEFEKNGK